MRSVIGRMAGPADVRGLTLRRIAERKQAGKSAVTTPVMPDVDEDLCIGCGDCEAACAYGAMRVEDKARVTAAACNGCGLCVSVCPEEAISQSYY